ncbi:hypothetical protein FOZ63_006741, partial [Perkinsus olseni]
SDELLHQLSLTSKGFTLCGSWKPHSNTPVDIILKSDHVLITLSKADSTAFCFRIVESPATLLPLGFIQVEDNTITSAALEGPKLLLALSDGSLREYDLSTTMSADLAAVESYSLSTLLCRQLVPVIPSPARIRNMKRREAKVRAQSEEPRDGEEEEEGEREGDSDDGFIEEPEVEMAKEGYVTACCLSRPSGRLLAGVGRYEGYLWELVDGEEEAMPRLDLMPDAHPVQMVWSPSGRLLIVGYNNGRVWLVPKDSSLTTYIEVACGDAMRGPIAAARLSADDRCLVVASRDGSFSIHTLQRDKIFEASRLLVAQRREGKSGIVDDMFPTTDCSLRCDLPPVDNSCWEVLADKAEVPGGMKTITTRCHYSLEKEKLKAEEEKAHA